MLDPSQVVGFDWDDGNRGKNWIAHRVSDRETEEVFLNRPLLGPDFDHSADEDRLFAAGLTDRGRRLIVFFTIRQARVRVISARPLTRRERARLPW
ncbi:MAG: BrnT family toxin [Chloroflexota bacterium]|nr:MAG: BrnT family toxin [Chloroflexota bacterium]